MTESDDSFLDYYLAELDFLRELGREFESRHPDHARHLGLSERSDPHIERLIEAVAFLNARTRRRLDDDFAETAADMLEVLHPEAVRPFPPATVVRLSLDNGQPDLVDGHEVPAGARMRISDSAGRSMPFRTCFPVRVLPLRTSEVEVQGVPFRGLPRSRFAEGARSVVRLELRTYNPAGSFAKIAADRLRFFVDEAPTGRFLEQLLNRTTGIAIGVPGTDLAFDLPAEATVPVGFGSDEGMLPASARTGYGLRNLLEFFSFPDKFRFVVLRIPAEIRRQLTGPIVTVAWFSSAEHRADLRPPKLILGATPAVNLFEPTDLSSVRMRPGIYEHRIDPPARERSETLDVYRVDSVIGRRRGARDSVEARSAYGHWWRRDAEAAPVYRVIRRDRLDEDPRRPASETLLTFSNLDGSSIDADWTFDVRALWYERKIPETMRVATGLTIDRFDALVEPSAVRGISPAIQPSRGGRQLWRLVSWCTTNHVALVDNDGEPLRELMALLDRQEDRAAQELRRSLVRVESRRVMEPDRLGIEGEPVSGSWCVGTEVRLVFDEAGFEGSGQLFQLASVLESVMTEQAAINSFVRTEAWLDGAGRPRLLARWRPRPGWRHLI